MKLPTDTYVSRIDIFQPKWSTRTVKIAKRKVGAHNVITFSKAKSLEGEWYVSGAKVRSYPVTQLKTRSGGFMDIYEIMLDDLEPMEWQKVTYIPVDDREAYGTAQQN